MDQSNEIVDTYDETDTEPSSSLKPLVLASAATAALGIIGAKVWRKFTNRLVEKRVAEALATTPLGTPIPAPPKKV